MYDRTRGLLRRSAASKAAAGVRGYIKLHLEKGGVMSPVYFYNFARYGLLLDRVKGAKSERKKSMKEKTKTPDGIRVVNERKKVGRGTGF